LNNSSKSWWCCIITRDGQDTLGITLDSIIGQSIRPEFIVIVDDNSKDQTPAIIEQKKNSLFPNLFSIKTSYKSRDIRRVPVLLNLGLAFVSREFPEEKTPKFMMVSGDDNKLVPGYVARILDRMNNEEKVVVASGSWLESSNQMPHGGGRIVKMDFMRRVGGKYPVAYGWETWLLYKALELGYSVRNYHDIRYSHLRPYNPRNLLGWGRAMYSLGFPTYFVILRFLLNFAYSGRSTQSRIAGVTMLVGFLQTKFNKESVRGMLIEDEPLKSFVRRFVTVRLVRLAL